MEILESFPELIELIVHHLESAGRARICSVSRRMHNMALSISRRESPYPSLYDMSLFDAREVIRKRTAVFEAVHNDLHLLQRLQYDVLLTGVFLAHDMRLGYVSTHLRSASFSHMQSLLDLFLQHGDWRPLACNGEGLKIMALAGYYQCEHLVDKFWGNVRSAHSITDEMIQFTRTDISRHRSLVLFCGEPYTDDEMAEFASTMADYQISSICNQAMAHIVVKRPVAVSYILSLPNITQELAGPLLDEFINHNMFEEAAKITAMHPHLFPMMTSLLRTNNEEIFTRYYRDDYRHPYGHLPVLSDTSQEFLMKMIDRGVVSLPVAWELANQDWNPPLLARLQQKITDDSIRSQTDESNYGLQRFLIKQEIWDRIPRKKHGVIQHLIEVHSKCKDEIPASFDPSAGEDVVFFPPTNCGGFSMFAASRKFSSSFADNDDWTEHGIRCLKENDHQTAKLLFAMIPPLRLTDGIITRIQRGKLPSNCDVVGWLITSGMIASDSIRRALINEINKLQIWVDMCNEKTEFANAEQDGPRQESSSTV